MLVAEEQKDAKKRTKLLMYESNVPFIQCAKDCLGDYTWNILKINVNGSC